MLINNNKDTPIEWKKVPKPLLILLPTDWLTFFSYKIPWLFPDFCLFVKFPWPISKFPDFSLTLKKIHFSLTFPWPWEPCKNNTVHSTADSPLSAKLRGKFSAPRIYQYFQSLFSQFFLHGHFTGRKKIHSANCNLCVLHLV